MGKSDKKRFDEQLQELRTNHEQKKRFILRKQEDEDAVRRLKEYLKHAMRHNDEDY